MARILAPLRALRRRQPDREASYIITKDPDGVVYAINGRTGEIDFSGPDATTVIQKALDSLTNGGKLFIKAGTYVINRTLVIRYSNIEIEGEGIDKTILKSNIWEPDPLGLGTYAIIHSIDSQKLTGIAIHDLTIDSFYDYRTDIAKVWVTGIELTNVDDW